MVEAELLVVRMSDVVESRRTVVVSEAPSAIAGFVEVMIGKMPTSLPAIVARLNLTEFPDRLTVHPAGGFTVAGDTPVGKVTMMSTAVAGVAVPFRTVAV